MLRRLIRLTAFAIFFIAVNACAITTGEVKVIASGEGDVRIEALNQAVTKADDKTAAFLQALSDDAVKVAGDKVFIVKDDKGFDPVSGAEVAVPDDAEAPGRSLETHRR